jgi:hypothetical protein
MQGYANSISTALLSRCITELRPASPALLLCLDLRGINCRHSSLVAAMPCILWCMCGLLAARCCQLVLTAGAITIKK